MRDIPHAGPERRATHDRRFDGDRELIRQLKADVEHLKHTSVTREDFTELQRSIEGLVLAWDTAGGLVRFVKWLAGVVAACAALWLTMKAVLASPFFK